MTIDANLQRLSLEELASCGDFYLDAIQDGPFLVLYRNFPEPIGMLISIQSYMTIMARLDSDYSDEINEFDQLGPVWISRCPIQTLSYAIQNIIDHLQTEDLLIVSQNEKPLFILLSIQHYQSLMALEASNSATLAKHIKNCERIDEDDLSSFRDLPDECFMPSG